jgi:predicted O-methyltransferase YrrM
VFKYNEIKKKLLETDCSQMSRNEREFLNGIIRKFRPQKILEVGVNLGGSSIIILNAINDIYGAKLYSIDLNDKEYVGECVNKYFPNLLKNWKLFKGNIATEFLRNIGNNIDMVFFDTTHLEPGEILDFLIVLPFLKEEAIVVFHDIAKQVKRTNRVAYAPYLIYNGIRGEKYLPSGGDILTHNIGGIKLEKNQYRYHEEYFRILGGQWQYFPKEIHIKSIRKFFQEYYDKRCLTIFEEATSFNRIFVRRNPSPVFYRYTVD